MPQVIAQPRFASARLATGVQLHYVEQGEPRGEAIVCLHGYTNSSFSFGLLFPLLATSPYQLFALDQRGHGYSERPIAGYAPDDFAADVIAFLDAVGVERATIIGHGMGAVIARRVAVRYPTRVARLVLIGALGATTTAALRELQQAVQALGDPIAADFVREFQASAAASRLPGPFLEHLVTESRRVPASVWRAVLDGLIASDDREELGQIAVPTLLLWGEADAYSALTEQQHLATAIPQARLVRYPATGHAPHWEHPDRVVASLLAFMAHSPSNPAPRSSAVMQPTPARRFPTELFWSRFSSLTTVVQSLPRSPRVG